MASKLYLDKNKIINQLHVKMFDLMFYYKDCLLPIRNSVPLPMLPWHGDTAAHKNLALTSPCSCLARRPQRSQSWSSNRQISRNSCHVTWEVITGACSDISRLDPSSWTERCRSSEHPCDSGGFCPGVLLNCSTVMVFTNDAAAVIQRLVPSLDPGDVQVLVCPVICVWESAGQATGSVVIS